MLLYMDGFDHYTNSDSDRLATLSPSLWSEGTTRSDKGVTKTMPVLGTRGLYSGNSGGVYDGARLAVPHSMASGTTIGIGFHHYFSSLPSSSSKGCLVAFASGVSSPVRTVRLDTSGQISFVNGDVSDSAIVTSSGTALTGGNLYHIEIKIYLHVSAGTLDIRVNGASFWSETGLNTLPSAINTLVFGQYESATSSTMQAYWDNLYVWDATGSKNNDFLGERVVETTFPDADTATADWTLSTGTDGFDLLNDVPAVDTTYISTSSTDDVAIFDMASLSSTNVAVAAIQLVVRGSKSASGDGTITSSFVANSVEDTPSSHPLTQGQFSDYIHLSDTNPDTSLNWSASDVNSVQIKIKRTL